MNDKMRIGLALFLIYFGTEAGYHGMIQKGIISIISYFTGAFLMNSAFLLLLGVWHRKRKNTAK